MILKEHHKKIFGGLSLGSALTILYNLNPERFVMYLNSALEHQVISFTFAFTLAAWIHSGRVKSEIKSQFSELIDCIDRFGGRIDKLEDRVDALEHPNRNLK